MANTGSNDGLTLSGCVIFLAAVNDVLNILFRNSGSIACTIGQTGNGYLSNLDIEYLGS
jgi:hypothetical protein